MKIVMAEHTHYESLYRVGCHHLADYLVAAGHEVLYLSGPMNPFNLRYFVTRDPSLGDLRYALGTWMAGGTSPRAGLHSYVPMTMLPIWRGGPFATDWVARHTLSGLFPPLSRVLNRYGFARPDVLLVGQLFFAGLLDRIPAKTRILRLTDDIDKFPNMPPSVRGLEHDAVARADAVIVTSTPLITKMEGLAAKALTYVPNGVDYAFYQTPRERPPELADVSGPVVVYMGALDSWFDTGLVAAAARAVPEATFVLIGAARRDLSALDEFQNVRRLGPRPYTALPAYLQHADVGIIPFTVTPLIESVSPLKLYEYMACGLPVVSTRWRELDHLASPARLVTTESDFVDGVRRAIAEGGQQAGRYREYASRNSWQERGRRVEALIGKLLSER